MRQANSRLTSRSYIGELKELSNYMYAHTEMALIRDVWGQGIFRSDIQILFKFDDTDSKLVRYSVQKIVTGP